MIVGTVKEIKKHEYRIGLTPNVAQAYLKNGHTVYVQKGAGEGSSFTDHLYEQIGCKLLDTAKEVFDNCDMIVKVKEPLKEEYDLIHENQILYTYLHLAADRSLTDALIRSNCIGIAFETITDNFGGLPCLKPMSQIAGRLAVQEGAKYLEKPFGGRGVLLSGVPGVPTAEVVVLGAGIVGSSAIKIAVGMGAHVTVLDINLNRLEYLEDIYSSRISTLYSTPENIEEALVRADLVIGGILLPGAAAPKLIKNIHLSSMKQGSVIVDVAIDQGGCSEASHVTYHDDPIFVKDGVVNYCVGNMPGAVANTSTLALSNATLGFGLKIANMGVEKALKSDKNLMNGLNIYKGNITCKGVAESLNIPYNSPENLIWLFCLCNNNKKKDEDFKIPFEVLSAYSKSVKGTSDVLEIHNNLPDYCRWKYVADGEITKLAELEKEKETCEYNLKGQSKVRDAKHAAARLRVNRNETGRC